jgi:prevent-host-death family protein
MKTVSSTEAKSQFNALLAEVERTGSPVTITSRGRPVAVLSPLRPRPRSFGQLPNMAIGADFDEPLPASELAAWEGTAGGGHAGE